jgi:hypothetical protein
MRRTISCAFVALLLASASVAAAQSDGRISGRLLEIRPDGKLVIEEQGPWKGPGTGLVTRMVDLTPGTSIRVVTPTGRWETTEASPGYEYRSADFTALRAGDFVTVHTGSDRASVAAALEIMRPAADADAGLASPRAEPGK